MPLWLEVTCKKNTFLMPTPDRSGHLHAPGSSPPTKEPLVLPNMKLSSLRSQCGTLWPSHCTYWATRSSELRLHTQNSGPQLLIDLQFNVRRVCFICMRVTWQALAGDYPLASLFHPPRWKLRCICWQNDKAELRILFEARII